MSLNPQIGERLREERKRLDMTQAQMAQSVGVGREMWARYEAGAEPGAGVLVGAAAIGVDVHYVLTGDRGPLTVEENVVLSYWREASEPTRKAALGALVGASPLGTRSTQQTFHAPVATVNNAQGDLTIKRPARKRKPGAL